MNHLNEELLDVWLNLSSSICNERIVSHMSFNEAFVCNLLYRQLKLDSNVHLTATDLCQKTRMLKSQMNKTLNTLEQRELIQKVRSTTDKRVIYILLREEHLDIYQEEHAHIIGLIDKLIDKLGIQETIHSIEVLAKITQNFNLILNEGVQNGD